MYAGAPPPRPIDDLVEKGGALRFVTDWLAREARTKAFVRAEQKRLQGDLFADAVRSPHRPGTEKPMSGGGRRVEPDPDHLSQAEEADGQKWRRRAAAQRGKPVKPPHP